MAQSIKAFRFSKKFKKEYQKLPKEIQSTFDKKLVLLMENMAHPSLRVKRIQGTSDRWEGSVTMKYRFTFEWISSTLFFRAIGTYDILAKEARQE